MLGPITFHFYFFLAKTCLHKKLNREWKKKEEEKSMNTNKYPEKGGGKK